MLLVVQSRSGGTAVASCTDVHGHIVVDSSNDHHLRMGGNDKILISSASDTSPAQQSLVKERHQLRVISISTTEIFI